MRKPELKHIAYHEAGHAAAQLVYGQTTTFVTIDPKGTTLGFAKHIDGDAFSEKGLRELIINCYAGREAEMRVGGDGMGSYRDDKEAESYLKHVGTEEEMRKATTEFVTEHWLLIKRIASELLEYTTLLMDELDSLKNIYRGEESEEDLQEFRDCWGFQRELEGLKHDGYMRGAYDDRNETA
jgi:ATP-dependent Zn protease